MVAWKDAEAARRLRALIEAIADDGASCGRAGRCSRMWPVSPGSIHRLRAYDAAYLAAAASVGGRLVSCDVKDLVSAELALLPAAAAVLDQPHEPPGAPARR